MHIQKILSPVTLKLCFDYHRLKQTKWIFCAFGSASIQSGLSSFLSFHVKQLDVLLVKIKILDKFLYITV